MSVNSVQRAFTSHKTYPGNINKMLKEAKTVQDERVFAFQEFIYKLIFGLFTDKSLAEIRLVNRESETFDIVIILSSFLNSNETHIIYDSTPIILNPNSKSNYIIEKRGNTFFYKSKGFIERSIEFFNLPEQNDDLDKMKADLSIEKILASAEQAGGNILDLVLNRLTVGENFSDPYLKKGLNNYGARYLQL